MPDKSFDEFLEHADQVVRSWPLWKQTLLGGTGKREEPREPVDNYEASDRAKFWKGLYLSAAATKQEQDKQLSDLSARVANRSMTIRGLETEISELRNEYESLKCCRQAETDQQQRELIQLRKEKEELKSENGGLREQNAYLLDQLQSGTGKREEPREHVDNFKQVADCLRSENRQLKAANEGLRKEVAGLYLAKSGQMAEIESLQRELRQVVNERDSVRSNLQHLETSYGKLSAEYWHEKAVNDEFSKNIHELNGRLEAVARIAESGWQE